MHAHKSMNVLKRKFYVFVCVYVISNEPKASVFEMIVSLQWINPLLRKNLFLALTNE